MILALVYFENSVATLRADFSFTHLEVLSYRHYDLFWRPISFMGHLGSKHIISNQETEQRCE